MRYVHAFQPIQLSVLMTVIIVLQLDPCKSRYKLVRVVPIAAFRKNFLKYEILLRQNQGLERIKV